MIVSLPPFFKICLLYGPQALQKAIAHGRIRYRHKLTPSIKTLTAMTQSAYRAGMQRQPSLEPEGSLGIGHAWDPQPIHLEMYGPPLPLVDCHRDSHSVSPALDCIEALP